MENIKMKPIQEIVKEFNRSSFRNSSIPQNLVAGWPSLRMAGKTLCLTIPYYARKFSEKKILLYPIYCSVTIPVGNTDKILDFTTYALQQKWNDVNFIKPAAVFEPPLTEDGSRPLNKGEYKALSEKLFGYYDELARSTVEKTEFENADEMVELFSRMVEKGLLPYYMRVNKKFYSYAASRLLED